MITSVHTLIYSDDAAATRAFLRDVVGWPYVEDMPEGGEGWLIFRSGQSEVGVHPTSASGADEPSWSTTRHHELCLMCDDLTATMAELQARGATFSGDVKDQGFGLTVLLEVPGADPIVLYEPRHAVAYP